MIQLLADQDVWATTVRLLRDHGIDVITAREMDLSAADDESLLASAADARRVLITRDKDFGSLIFGRGMRSCGVILLRVSPENMPRVHEQLIRLLTDEKPEALSRSVAVVESDRYRIRRLL